MLVIHMLAVAGVSASLALAHHNTTLASADPAIPTLPPVASPSGIGVASNERLETSEQGVGVATFVPVALTLGSALASVLVLLRQVPSGQP
ncbi:hypothetical protein BKA70DRAFT_1429142 [Coprinopsis sp. MPI-PUGE-AT-0042]|nr:hypothetical protein BKA70DRAFT_1429142 [Coprinopsis sp. MPI-PUGE-AT-0042]